ncbi:MAG: methyltransferase domain-containing protein [Bryobacterales bacterium]|nr:methyltransferase domain-containing protein [Bryobacterales bacterium]
MPPAKSGIADYSAVLVDHLRANAEVETISSARLGFSAASFDAVFYQIGNNGYHDFVYETAIAQPGIVVLHESNLHHLLTDLTIRRKDWDAYVEACAYDGGPAAGAFAERVRALEVGPDYEGVPMLRRLLERSKAVIVHSRAVETDVRRAGFNGPVARIPHGAWLPDGDRMGFRARLGLDEQTPLIGVFGFLKPYKRIAESLRAMRRLVRVRPDVKMILCGEAHPDFPVAELIRGLGLESNVRMMGYVPIEDFTGYISACDIVLNLRYPTVGESSGTLLRSLGLGRAVIVSNVGSFAEFPNGICLKVPVDASEEDSLYEYLNLLVSRPGVARAMGARARQWVADECNWGRVASMYRDFAHAVRDGREWTNAEPSVPIAVTEEIPVELIVDLPPDPPAPKQVEPEYILNWAARDAESTFYAETHITRLERTLNLTPPGNASDRVLEMGAYMQMTPALRGRLGYGEVRGCYYGPAGQIDHREVRSADGEIFRCDVDLFDAEKDPFPYPDEHFTTVLCCELLEHLPSDPMFMMAEINRILRPGGHLVITTPNVASIRALRAILEGYHPGFFPAYIRPAAPGAEVEARHAREYTPREIHYLLQDAGFEVARLETGEFLDKPRPEERWIIHLLERYQLPKHLRGDGIYAVGKKQGPVAKRYPAWLYEGGD